MKTHHEGLGRIGGRAAAFALLGAAVVGVAAVGCNVIVGLHDVNGGADDAASGDATTTHEAGDGQSPDATTPDADARAADSGVPEAGDASAPDASHEGGAADSGASDDAAADAARDAADSGPCGRSDDARNCGACGHDCLGGACVSGVCQAFPLVDSDAGVAPSRLAQDEAYLYWTDTANNTVNRTDKTTGATVRLTDQTFLPSGIVVDSTSVYWGDSAGVWRCAKSGCQPQPIEVAKAVNYVGDVSVEVDGGDVFWTEDEPQIYRAHKYGTSETGVLVWDGGAATHRLANDGQRLFFTAEDGELHAVDFDGGAPVAIGTPGDAGSFGIAADQGVVYWTIEDWTNGSIIDTSSSGLNVNVLTRGQRDPLAVASDGVSAYWVAVFLTASGSSEIVGCDVLDCTPKVYAKGLYSPSAIVLDRTAVYFADKSSAAGSGILWKMAR